jgi:hypothetical protein
MTTATMTDRETLVARADHLRRKAEKATECERAVLLRKAANYYRDAGLTGFAGWCERHAG